MSSDRETTRIVRSWLEEGVTALPDRVLDAVLDQVPTTPQLRSSWPLRRYRQMNRVFAATGAVAAVLVLAVVGFQFFGGTGTGGPGASASPQPSAAEPTPSSSQPTSSPAWIGLGPGPSVVNATDETVRIALDFASPGWFHHPLSGLEIDYVNKNDDGRNPPESVVAMIVASSWPAGTAFNVSGDPCYWSPATPETAATTLDEIAAAFASLAFSDAPVDVSVGGYPGKKITLQVPMTFLEPNPSREEPFADCVDGAWAFRYAVGDFEWTGGQAGQIDDLLIVDVDGSIVILNTVITVSTPAYLIEEARTLAESATFEAP